MNSLNKFYISFIVSNIVLVFWGSWALILFVEFFYLKVWLLKTASIYNIYRYKKIDSTLPEFNYCKMFFACFYISLDFIRWKALNFMDCPVSTLRGSSKELQWLTLSPANKLSSLKFPFTNVVCAEYSLIFTHQDPSIVILRNKKFMSKVNGGWKKTGQTLWKLGGKFSS